MRQGGTDKRRSFGYWLGSFLLLAVVIFLPVMASVRVAGLIGYKTVVNYLGAVFLVTALVYRSDKRKAREGEWRIPETTLHFLEFIGGWASAFISQRVIRHKISKRAYQVTFWLISVIHNGVSFDYLNDWHYSFLLLQKVKPVLEQLL